MKEPGRYDCLAGLELEEPFFVLRGQDILAAELVREWVMRAGELGCPGQKLAEALECADAMEEWARKHGKAPD